ncbi:UNVERIFIED_CONTAM: hypothetical protein PYX00_004001 [Menopon gallinae]|uniref:CHK kinase-like domain-containing protein n=1 Tax=Menopon gallinae TaxID=328185 RepID=A0AAW2I2E0_9NEOP
MGTTLNEEEVSEVVRSFAGDHCELVSYAVDPARDHPSGFLGEHKRLRINFRRGKGDEEKICFVKKMPEKVPVQWEYLKRVRCFEKEIGMYRTVFPELERSAEGVAKWRPECYFSKGEELLVLEDLAQEGYCMYAERKLMDEEHILLTLQALARMHACSIIYEAGENRKPIREAFSKYLFETVATAEKGHPGNTSHEAAISAQLKLVDLLPDYTPQQKEVIKRDLPFRMRRIFTLVKPSQKFRNVVVHGDLWSNNVLFLDDGHTKNAKIVDFQLARFAPPAHDIVTFLYVVQNKKFREENHLRLLRHYYDELSSCLRKNGLQAKDFLTWYELLGTCDYYEELGIITALFFFQFILTPPDLCAKYFTSPEKCPLVDPELRSEVVTECFLKDSIYRERVTEVMNELIREHIL